MTAVCASFFLKDKFVIFGLFGGSFIGLLNVVSLHYTTEKFDIKSYFIKTIVKFAVLVGLFYIFLKLKADPLALIGGFTISIVAVIFEVLRKCLLSKKQ